MAGNSNNTFLERCFTSIQQWLQYIHNKSSNNQPTTTDVLNIGEIINFIKQNNLLPLKQDVLTSLDTIQDITAVLQHHNYCKSEKNDCPQQALDNFENTQRFLLQHESKRTFLARTYTSTSLCFEKSVLRANLVEISEQFRQILHGRRLATDNNCTAAAVAHIAMQLVLTYVCTGTDVVTQSRNYLVSLAQPHNNQEWTMIVIDVGVQTVEERLLWWVPLFTKPKELVQVRLLTYDAIIPVRKDVAK